MSEVLLFFTFCLANICFERDLMSDHSDVEIVASLGWKIKNRREGQDASLFYINKGKRHSQLNIDVNSKKQVNHNVLFYFRFFFGLFLQDW